MIELKRRRAFALFSAVAITKIVNAEAAPASSAGPDLYGAAKVADTNPAALSASLSGQLSSAGLPAPKMNVFPELRGLRDRVEDWLDNSSMSTNKAIGISAPGAPLEGDMVPPKGIFGTRYRINGLSEGTTGDDFLARLTADRSKDHVLSGACPCGSAHNRLSDNYPAFRVFAALHETAHFVAEVKTLNQSTTSTVAAREDNAPVTDKGFQTNIRERIADTAAALYLVSNYGDAKPYLQDVKNLRDGMLEPTHYASSSIDAGLAAFEKTPRTSLSIVEATKWAAEIVGKQPGLSAEYKNARASFTAANNGTTAALPAESQAMVKQAVTGRRALFSGSSR